MKEIFLLLFLLIVFLGLIVGVKNGLLIQITEKSSVLVPIEQYVRENISNLSPQKEVLGGKFYVTKIDARNGKGNVHYEDGHVAFVADFTYTQNPTGTPMITSFIVQGQD